MKKQFKEISEEERYTKRLEQTKPVLDDFYAWLETVNPVQGSGFAKAVQYAENEKQYLYSFLKNANVPVDNNMAERTVKPFVIGIKRIDYYHPLLMRRIKCNYLFCCECRSS